VIEPRVDLRELGVSEHVDGTQGSFDSRAVVPERAGMSPAPAIEEGSQSKGSKSGLGMAQTRMDLQ